MEIVIAWAAFGALIGYVAAQKKGFSTVAGLLGGAALGLAAPLLFLVSGIARAGDISRRQCPFCREWVKPDATVCRYCHRDLPNEAVAKDGSTYCPHCKALLRPYTGRCENCMRDIAP
jgi:hypothetical protein